MSQLAIITDLNRCVGCQACTVACKTVNDVPIGSYWNRMLRVGPNPKPNGSGQFPDVEMYFIPKQCQHCVNPPCVQVCPVGATYKLDNGIVKIDTDVCIGCQSCVGACPYGIRYLDMDMGAVQKCTMCEEKVARGELPQCVTQCGGSARFFGDLDEGLESFEGPAPLDVTLGDDLKKVNPIDYEHNFNSRGKMLDMVEEFTDDQFYTFTDSGNSPAFGYILRKTTWRTDDVL